ncbi:MAG: MoxR family ATPase [Armatimonadetes bacterium]|nr:MoxR family ATPase [Armatimonadota bacterium]MDW8123002.1 MoxR family ATPase [Armatimonadota bacterium]
MSRVVETVEKVIVGKPRAVRLAVTALFAGGHLLIEDIPGVGKTTLAKALALSLSGSFKRIQFTPDLLPSDITGVSVYNQKTGEFEFRPGPIFANVVLADEINRATPRTQAALLEAMEEIQVSVDGVSRPLPRPFFVIATNNPIERHGTYPLPEAQLDRFLMQVSLGYPGLTEETEILERQVIVHPLDKVQPVMTSEQVLAVQQEVRKVRLTNAMRRYLVQIVHQSRNHPMVELGASPRGSLGLMRASQAWALLHGRDFITPDDVKDVGPAVLSHRVILKAEARARGMTPQAVASEIVAAVPIPLER